MLAGLVVDSDNLPNFNRNDRKLNVNHNWADNQWNNTAMVRFRDYSLMRGSYGPSYYLKRLYPAAQHFASLINGSFQINILLVRKALTVLSQPNEESQ